VSSSVPESFANKEAAKAAAIETAKSTGLKASDLAGLSPKEFAVLEKLPADKIAQLKGLKGKALAAKLGEISAPELEKIKVPEVPKVEVPKVPGLDGLTSQAAPPALKKGMTQQEVKTALGRPSYKYNVAGEETWVFENSNFVTKQVKTAGVNLVPLVGPAATLMGSFRDSPAKPTKAAVTFDPEGKVNSFKQG